MSTAFEVRTALSSMASLALSSSLGMLVPVPSRVLPLVASLLFS